LHAESSSIGEWRAGNPLTEETPPSVVVMAGPNGSRKSTIATLLLRSALELTQLVNADTLARSSPRAPAWTRQYERRCEKRSASTAGGASDGVLE
jgi:hypothetical protein